MKQSWSSTNWTFRVDFNKKSKLRFVEDCDWFQSISPVTHLQGHVTYMYASQENTPIWGPMCLPRPTLHLNLICSLEFRLAFLKGKLKLQSVAQFVKTLMLSFSWKQLSRWDWTTAYKVGVYNLSYWALDLVHFVNDLVVLYLHLHPSILHVGRKFCWFRWVFM